ncbi:hypothetical protein Tco_0436769 [Tanacetum coccineum]
MRPAASAPCVCELDASSGVRRPNELKRNVVEQDDRQVNVPFKRTCVRSLDLFLSLDQQPYIVLRVYLVDPSLHDSNGVSPVGPSAGRLKRNISSQDDSQNGFDVASTVPSKRLCAAIKCRFRTSYTQFLPQPINSVNVNLSSTPIDDHRFRCPTVSSDTRYTPAVTRDTSWQRSRRAPTVNMATSRQQPPGSGPPSDYRYLGAYSYSCQNCGALFWGEERLKMCS